jgi:cell division protein FtsW (lipid II flippase)
MPEHKKRVQDFLDITCSQIRFRSVHKSIVNELSDHIEEQKAHYIREGLDEEAATEKALEQMGDPILVGKQLNKAHQPRTEWSVLSLAAILVVIGGAVQFFLSRVDTYHYDLFSRFLVYAIVGIAAFAVTYFLDYTLLGLYSRFAYVVLLAATIAGFLVFDTVRGAHEHVYYAALLFIPIFAGIAYSFRNKGYWGILACGLFYVPVAFVCFIAPRLTVLLLLTAACLTILTIAIEKGLFKCNKKAGLAMIYIPTVLIAIISILLLRPYQIARLSAMLNPRLDPLGHGYQYLMVNKMISISQPFGKAAPSDSFTNMRIEQLLPGWSTDFSLTYIITQFGYVAGIAMILTIIAFVVRMFTSVNKQKNILGFLLSCAACISITGQFILYILTNLGMIVPLSVTLPFISFGGMGFVTNMILLGIVLSVYRRTDIVIDRQQNNYCSKKLFTFEDGKLIIDFGIRSSKNAE